MEASGGRASRKGKKRAPARARDGPLMVRLPLPGRKMPLLVPRRALATAVTLIVLLVATALAYHWVATTQARQAEQVGGLPIGTRTEWSLSYCLKVTPNRVEALPGQNVTFVLQWRAFHYDCPYWLPYDRSVEGVIVNTNITYVDVVPLNETEWAPVDELHETFRKEVTVQATTRDGYVRLFRDCPWYFDQRTRGVVDVPGTNGSVVEAKRQGTLPAIWDRVRQSPMATLAVLSSVVIGSLLVARRFSSSVRQLRAVSQLAFFGAINVGALGFWAMRTEALPLTAALPATSCNYLDYNVGACVVYQLQHFLSVGILATWAFVLILVLAFLVLYVALGRAWCGWACPLGMVQDGIDTLRSRLGIKRYKLSAYQRQVLLVVRYSVFFVGVLLSVLIGVTLISFYLSRGDIYRPICQVCPAYPLFTLSQAGLGLTTAAGARQIPWLSLGILAAFMVASVRVRRPFCRVCPVSVVMMPFSKVSGVSLHKDPKKCTRCSMCHRVCPVDVTEVWKEMERTDVTVPECILCMRCVEACPEDGCLTGRVLGINVTESSYAKFLNSHKRSVRERVVVARRDRGSEGGGG